MAIVSRVDPLIARNVFSGNVANVEGGGVRFCFFGGLLPAPVVTGNVLVGNVVAMHASALCCLDAVIDCENLTIVGNSCQAGTGGAVAVISGSLVLRNCIATGNQGGGICRVGGSLVTEYCDVTDNGGGDYLNCTPAPTDISCDPEFCDATGGDFQLYETSCCEGAGYGGADIGALGVECFTVPDVLFYDNFSDQSDDGWVATAAGSSAFSIDVGTYLGTAVGPGEWARSVVQAEEPFSDFSCGVSVQRTAGTQPDALHEVYLRYTDADHYYRVQMDESGGGLYKRYGQTTVLLVQFDASFPSDTWARLAFTVMGTELTGAVRDSSGQEPLFVYHDLTSPIVAGTVGVGVGAVSGPSQARFDDVMIALIDSTATSVPEEDPARVSSVRAYGLAVRPNPFRSMVTIEFELTHAAAVAVGVYAVDGRRVRTLIDERREGCRQRVIWNGRDNDGRSVGGGTYFVTLTAGDIIQTRKVVYLGRK